MVKKSLPFGHNLCWKKKHHINLKSLNMFLQNVYTLSKCKNPLIFRKIILFFYYFPKWQNFGEENHRKMSEGEKILPCNGNLTGAAGSICKLRPHKAELFLRYVEFEGDNIGEVTAVNNAAAFGNKRGNLAVL